MRKMSTPRNPCAAGLAAPSGGRFSRYYRPFFRRRICRAIVQVCASAVPKILPRHPRPPLPRAGSRTDSRPISLWCGRLACTLPNKEVRPPRHASPDRRPTPRGPAGAEHRLDSRASRAGGIQHHCGFSAGDRRSAPGGARDARRERPGTPLVRQPHFTSVTP